MLLFFFLSCLFTRPMAQKDIFDIKNSYAYVISGGAFGSGNIINYKKKSYFITASHVIDPTSTMKVFDRVDITSLLVYNNEINDIAVYRLDGYYKSIDYQEPKKLKHGDTVHYWCMPGRSPVKYFTGSVSKVDKDQIIINGFGWFGCSGSVIFDKNNAVVGVMSGIMYTQDANIGGGTVHSSIIHVSKFDKIFFGE